LRAARSSATYQSGDLVTESAHKNTTIKPLNGSEAPIGARSRACSGQAGTAYWLPVAPRQGGRNVLRRSAQRRNAELKNTTVSHDRFDCTQFPAHCR